MSNFISQLELITQQLMPASRAGAVDELYLLGRLGIDSYDKLLALAVDGESSDLREIACWYLARLGDQCALPALARCLQADDPALRREAARSLGILDGAHACERLVDCLHDDPDIDVRMYAANSLGMIGGAMAFQALCAALRNAAEDASVRAMAAESLAYIRDRRAISELIAVLDDPSAVLRYWAVFALGQIGDFSVLPMLERLREDRDGPPGLGSVGDKAAEAIEWLTESAECE